MVDERPEIPVDADRILPTHVTRGEKREARDEGQG